MSAPRPSNEKARLEVLRKLQILDTAPEVSFDEITRLAAEVCNCPFSVVSLIDNDRQWFKSTFNLEVRETPRSESFCAHTILEPELLVVTNAKNDERFNKLNIVTGDHDIHFYAGVPICFEGGFNLGAVCVFDSKPHVLSDFQLSALKGLAKLAAKLLEGQKSYIEMQEMSLAMIEARKHIAHTAQMNALAEMAGGVAHEINSPLAVIKMTVELLKENLLQNANPAYRTTEQFNRIEKATDRIQNLTRGLMTYSRDSRKDLPSDSLIKNVLTDTLQFCNDRLKKSGAQLIIDTFDPELTMQCNPVEISQVILNLVHNACDAVKELPEKWIRITLLETTSEIQLSVTDSGSGIPEKIRKEIFQPFFTTKKLNHGTGLGLSICRGIIERHNGTIEVDSRSEHTCFVLKFTKPSLMVTAA